MQPLGQLVAFVSITDPARARQFYADTLGLKLVEENGFALVFDVGGTMLRATIVEQLTPQAFTVLGWWVDDIDASIDALAAKGVAFTDYGMGQDARRIWKSPSGARIAWFADPDGNVLSLTS